MKSISVFQRLSRKAILAIFGKFFRTFCSVEVYGAKNIPEEGPYIVVFNHVSIFDPPAVISLLPIQPEVFAASYLWRKFGSGILMRLYGAIPVPRALFNRKALATARQIIYEKQTLMLSPEGTRSGEPGMNQAKPGIAYIAGNTECLVVPVGIEGTGRNLIKEILNFSKPKIILRVGVPTAIHLFHKTGKKRKQELQQEADTIMVKIAEMLPDSYWGYYSKIFRKS